MERKKTLKIMLADDDQDDRDFMKFLFDQNSKFEIVGTYAAAEEVLLEIAKNGNVPDVLMIDLYMPFMTGTELLAYLIRKNLATGMYTFIISNLINDDEEKKFLGNPNVKFLKKPVSLKEMNDLPGIILECLNYRNNTKV